MALKELGPRFTLKLRSLQKGTFNSKHGHYEWIQKVRSSSGRGTIGGGGVLCSVKNGSSKCFLLYSIDLNEMVICKLLCYMAI